MPNPLSVAKLGVGYGPSAVAAVGLSVSSTPDTRLDQILALLTGRKVYDKTSGLWRVYDAGGTELADPGGALWRGLHGWMLYQNSHLRGGTDYILRARRRGRR